VGDNLYVIGGATRTIERVPVANGALGTPSVVTGVQLTVERDTATTMPTLDGIYLFGGYGDLPVERLTFE
jgi:hypothetical protein